MRIQITAKYPKKIVEDLVKIAYEWAHSNHSFKPDYLIKVKNSQFAFAGRFFHSGKQINIRVGEEKKFPRNAKYPGLKTSPEYTINDWKEAVFAVAIHEFWHGIQKFSKSPYSEIECEKITLKFLIQFREYRPQLELKWGQIIQEKSLPKQSNRNSHEIEMEKISKKISLFSRRIKLYSTKLKKLNRRQTFLKRKLEESACQPCENL